MAGRALNKLSAVQAARIIAPRGATRMAAAFTSSSTSKAGDGRIFMYTRRGKRTELGLGGGRDLSLANARAEATKQREILAAGGDPKAERTKDDHIPTFGECADAYVEAMKPSWRNAKHAAQWTMTLTKYAKPMRSKPVNEITTQEVLDVLQLLWQRRPRQPRGFAVGSSTCSTPPRPRGTAGREPGALARASRRYLPPVTGSLAAIMPRCPMMPCPNSWPTYGPSVGFYSRPRVRHTHRRSFRRGAGRSVG